MVIQKGVRQGDPIPPKLVTATTGDVFDQWALEQQRLMIEGESLTDLRFADDVVTENTNLEFKKLVEIDISEILCSGRYIHQNPNYSN